MITTAEGTTDIWSALGTPIDDSTVDAATAMEQAGLLGWNTRMLPQTYSETLPDGTTRGGTVPNRFALVRNVVGTDELQHLGDATAQYKIFQNEDWIPLLEAVREQSGARFHAGGILREGRQVFTCLSLDNGIPALSDYDPHSLALTLFGRHDARGQNHLTVTPNRIRCANAQNFALATAVRTLSFRHTDKHAELAADVQRTMEAIGLYQEEFGEAVQRMGNQPLTEEQFLRAMRKVWPLEDGARPHDQKRHQDRLDGLLAGFHSPLQDNCRGTLLAGVNAVSHWLDHEEPVKKCDDERAARARRSMPGQRMDELKKKAEFWLTA